MSNLKGMSLTDAMNSLNLKEDVNPVKRKKTVKLNFTIKEYNAYVSAIDKFLMLTTDTRFMNIIKEIYGNQTRIEEIQQDMINPIVESVYGDQKEVVKIKREIKEDNFFTKRMDATSASRRLFNEVKDVGKPLRYDQETYTCIMDVKMLASEYLKRKDGEFGMLARLAPNTFDSHPDPENVKSTVFTIAKEITKWK